MWLAGLDMPDDKDSKPAKPYKQVALVYICVNKLINAIAGLPLVLSTIDEKIVESGPVYDLFFNNPATSWQKFITETIGHYALTRDVFWIFLDSEGSNPKEILIVSGTQMHPLTSDGTAGGQLIGWEFRGFGGQRVRFTLDEVYQWKNFNPYDRFHGLGPATASNLNINYSFAADLYNSNALANAAEPGAILTTAGKLDEDQIRLIRNQFEARHKGSAKAKRTAVLTGGLDIKTIAMKMTDMQVAKITEMSDKKICSSFGIPPGVAGLITEAQYSHGPAMQDFIFNTVIPLATLFADELTAGILSRFSSAKWLSNSDNFPAIDIKDAKFYSGLRHSLSKNVFYRQGRHKAVAVQKKVFAWFDAGQHPVVQEHQREVAEKVLKFTEAGVMLNDIIEAHDLPYKEVPWGNDWWIPMGNVPARLTLEAGLEGITGPSLPEGQPQGEEEPEKSQLLSPSIKSIDKDSDQQRLRLWRNWVISWAGIEREYKDAMRKFFVRQQRILLDKLKKALSELKFSNNEIRAPSDDIIARVVFDLKIEDNKIKVINQVFFGKAVELGIRQGLVEIAGFSGDKLDELTEQIKRIPVIKGKLIISTHKITGINKTTQRLIANQLRTGLEAEEGLNELAVRVSKTLGSNRARALSIARTQTAGAIGTGRHEGLKAAGIELKSWVTSGDSNVRDAHIAAGQRYADGIPVDQPFEIDGELLMYPGDPAGSAHNIINCRCVEIARRAAGKIFELSHYSKFYSYSDMQKDNKNGT